LYGDHFSPGGIWGVLAMRYAFWLRTNVPAGSSGRL
jgi:hypothetical protein